MLNSAAAKKARWRTLGPVQTVRDRQGLMKRLARDGEETTVAIHTRRLLRAGIKLPGGHDAILQHAPASQALGRLVQ